VVAMVGLNLRWYWAYRRGFPLHIDESVRRGGFGSSFALTSYH